MTPNFTEGLADRDTRLVQITDAAFADAAARSGPHLVCRPGCTQCCHGAFAIDALDAWRLRHGLEMLAVSDPLRARAVVERARAYVREYSAAFPGEAATGILGSGDEERAAFESFADEAACPALDPASGHCDMYAARPMICRTFGPPLRGVGEAGEGLAVCELCFTSASETEIAAAEMTPPYREEAELLKALAAEGRGAARDGETVVAWCLAQD